MVVVVVVEEEEEEEVGTVARLAPAPSVPAAVAGREVRPYDAPNPDEALIALGIAPRGGDDGTPPPPPPPLPCEPTELPLSARSSRRALVLSPLSPLLVALAPAVAGRGLGLEVGPCGDVAAVAAPSSKLRESAESDGWLARPLSCF